MRCLFLPGSALAVVDGCSCPVFANSQGRGAYIECASGDAYIDSGRFVTHEGCLLHGWMKDPRFSIRVRHAAGDWWIDEFTNPKVVFVCHRNTEYYVPMDMIRTDDQVENWVRHVSAKRWGKDGAETLRHLLAVGMTIQSFRKPSTNLPRWHTIDDGIAQTIIDELDARGDEANRTAASVLRAVHAKRARALVVGSVLARLS